MNVFSCILILVEASLNGSQLEHERSPVSRILKFPPRFDPLGPPQMVLNLDLSMAIPKTSKLHRIQLEVRDESSKLVRMDFLSIYIELLKLFIPLDR